MSTILDALKRSEQERKLNEIPTLSDMPAPQERPRWPLLLIGVLVLLLLAALVWLLLGKKSPEAKIEAVIINNDTISGAPIADNANEAESVNVNVISYSDQASARFVIANGKIFREGEFVMAGIKVESILQDSVVLIERGKRVTRQP